MNQDVSDDFTDPSGTVFPINMTESEIYDNFGEKCMWLTKLVTLTLLCTQLHNITLLCTQLHNICFP